MKSLKKLKKSIFCQYSKSDFFKSIEYEAESEVGPGQKGQEGGFWSFSYKCNVSMASGAFWKL